MRRSIIRTNGLVHLKTGQDVPKALYLEVTRKVWNLRTGGADQKTAIAYLVSHCRNGRVIPPDVQNLLKVSGLVSESGEVHPVPRLLSKPGLKRSLMGEFLNFRQNCHIAIRVLLLLTLKIC